MVFSSIQLTSDHVSLFSRLLLYSKANGLHKWIERTRRDQKLLLLYLTSFIYFVREITGMFFFIREKEGKKVQKVFLKKKMSVPNHADYLSLFQAVLCYWVTSNMFTILQLAVLKHPAVREKLGIPEMRTFENLPSGGFLENMKAGKLQHLCFSHSMGISVQSTNVYYVPTCFPTQPSTHQPTDLSYQ